MRWRPGLRADAGDDFATVSYSQNELTTYLNEGAGKFAARSTLLLSGFQPGFVALADFNGDGVLDAVTGNLGSHDIGFSRGEGTGSFTNAGLYPLDGVPIGLLAADLDGNGLSDVLVLESGCPTELQVLLSN